MSRLPKSELISLWLDRLNRFAKSDLTVANFCQREHVSLPSFYQWKRRLSPRVDVVRPRRPCRSRQRPGKATAEPARRPLGFAELVINPMPSAAHAMLPGGITISLGDQLEMAQLIVDRLLRYAIPTDSRQEDARSC